MYRSYEHNRARKMGEPTHTPPSTPRQPIIHLLSTAESNFINAGEVLFKSQSAGHRGGEGLWTGAHLSICLSPGHYKPL